MLGVTILIIVYFQVIFKKRCSPSLSWEAHVQYLPAEMYLFSGVFFFFFFGWRHSFEALSPSLVTSYELCKESPCALGQVYPQKNFRWTVGSFACCIVEINFYVWVYNNNVSKISLKLYFILKWYIHPSHLFLPCLWQRRGEKWLIIWYQSFLWPKGRAGTGCNYHVENFSRKED